jgi:Ca2+-binding RTX toxin-like protein
MPSISGTPGDDTLTGTAGDDVIDGLGGNDIITDTAGGFDLLRGGDGNDTLIAERLTTSGTVDMDGGDGDDRFFLSVADGTGPHSLIGGNGADYFDVNGLATIQAGAGDDIIVWNRRGTYFLGSGSDVIFLPGSTLIASGPGDIRDFTPGAGGDRIDWGTALAGLWGWDQSSNPFGTFLRVRELSAFNNAVEFRLDSGDPIYHTLLLTNLFPIASLTAFNLGGYALDGSAPAAQNLTGSAGADTLDGGVGSDTINGSGGNDVIRGGAGADQIDGGDDNDTIDGGLGSDTIAGGAGNDVITDAFGFAGTINGGTGNDTITVDLSANTQPIGPLVGPALFTRTINGGGDDDNILAIGLLLGSNYNDFTIDGGTGNDRIEISTSRATVQAGDGNDIVTADIRSPGGTTVTLGAGVDTVRVGALMPVSAGDPTSPIIVTDFQPGAGGDVFDLPDFFIKKPLFFSYVGNPFMDGYARLVQSGADVQVQVKTSGSTYWTLAVLQNVVIAQLSAENMGGFAPNGTLPPDLVLNGDGGPNTLAGGLGNDQIQGFGGNDVLTGGFGTDLLRGGEGDDFLDGQWASDTLEGENGNDILVDSLGGSDTLRGGDGDDVLTVTRAGLPNGTLVLEGGAGNDRLTSPTGTLNGGDGNDIITATSSQFNILGGDGNDLIVASYPGTIDAGAGNDVLTLNSPQGLTGDQPFPTNVTLGAGKDLVIAGNRAQITISDFKVGEDGDRLDISVQGADPFRPGGPLLIDQVGADTVIRLRNGGTAPGFRITLLNVQATELSPYNLSGVDSHVFAPAPQSFEGTADPDTFVSADGADTIRGHGGNDVLYGAGGNDLIEGGDGNDEIVGGSGDDTLRGGANNDFLEGGAGTDQLAGGTGDDVYVVESPSDVIVEAAGEGFDIVYSRSSYALGAAAEVEILSSISQDATTAMELVGNGFSQIIYGNAGANFLQGGGGTDYLVGLGGNDTYFVAGPGDNVVESVGGGARDVVYTPLDLVMTAGQDIEVLSSSNQSGTNAQTLVGNGIAQEIYGNNGANFIDGGGGADFLSGLGGNDVYIVDSADDFVFESAGGGRDVVYARANYALGASQEVEVLSAQSQSSISALDLSGNNLANELYGNAGANTLNGGGAADYLMGFGGADIFQFTTALGGGNVDALADFSAVDDTIALDDAVFAGLTPGALPASAFVAGSAAADADDRIIYDSATGQILFDADGNGSGLAVLFATVQPGTTLTASDFTVI